MTDLAAVVENEMATGRSYSGKSGSHMSANVYAEYLKLREQNKHGEQMATRLNKQDQIPWQCGLANIQERIAALYVLGHHTDLTITFPGQKNTMKVHRLMLSMSSPVFEAMLFGPLAEGDVLTLDDDPPEAFAWLLAYLYKDNTDLPSLEMAIQVYQLAHKYQLDKLFDICSQFMSDRMDEDISEDHFLIVYDAAHLLEDKHLLQQCGEVLEDFSEAILESREIGKMRRSSLHHLLSHPQLCVASEVTVFRALHRWGLEQITSSSEKISFEGETCLEEPEGGQSKEKLHEEQQTPIFGSLHEEQRPVPEIPHQEQNTTEKPLNTEVQKSVPENCHDQHPSPPHSKLRQEVEEFLPLVKFLTMTAGEIIQHVLPTGIITKDESLAILCAVKGVFISSLPRFIPFHGVLKHKQLEKSALLLEPQSSHKSSITFTYANSACVTLLENFVSSKTICLLKVEAACVTSFNEGTMTVYNESKHSLGKGIWQGARGRFKLPVKLIQGRKYSVKLNIRDVWHATTKSSVSAKHETVTFSGQTHCIGKLRIVYFLL